MNARRIITLCLPVLFACCGTTGSRAPADRLADPAAATGCCDPGCCEPGCCAPGAGDPDCCPPGCCTLPAGPGACCAVTRPSR